MLGRGSFLKVFQQWKMVDYIVGRVPMIKTEDCNLCSRNCIGNYCASVFWKSVFFLGKCKTRKHSAYYVGVVDGFVVVTDPWGVQF